MSETLVPPSPEPQNLDDDAWTPDERLLNPEGLRRRRKRRVTGFAIDSDCEPEYEEYDASESEASCGGPSTPRYMSLTPPMVVKAWDAAERDEEAAVFSPRMLPMYTDEASIMSVQGSLSFAGSCADALGPYHELCEAERDGDAGKAEEVLKRLLTEWYVVGASVSPSSALHVATPLTLGLRRNSSWRSQALTSRCSGLRRTGSSPNRTGSRGSAYRSARSLRAWGSPSMHGSYCATPARASPSSRYASRPSQPHLPPAYRSTRSVAQKTCTARTSSSASPAACRRSSCSSLWVCTCVSSSCSCTPSFPPRCFSCSSSRACSCWVFRKASEYASCEALSYPSVKTKSFPHPVHALSRVSMYLYVFRCRL